LLPDPALVRAESLTRVFGDRDGRIFAVRDATFVIDPGEQVVVTGPSGSGKTTLLHLIAGLEPATTGSIRWPSIGALEDLRPGPVGVAFQGRSLMSPLSVLENVALPMILADWTATEAEGAARTLLTTFAIDEVANKLPEEISGGQAQRAAIARAFAGRPRLVLADEPTGQQDRDTARLVVDAILHVAETVGAGVVIATHDPAIVDRVPGCWTMRDGSLATVASRC